MGGDLPSFAEVVRLEASCSVKLRVPLVEMCELDLLPTVKTRRLRGGENGVGLLCDGEETTS